MQLAEWFDFMAQNGNRVCAQLQTRLPEIEFTHITPGLPPLVYLQQQGSTGERTVQAITLDLDDGGGVRGVVVLDDRPVG